MMFCAGVYTTNGDYPKEDLTTFFNNNSISNYKNICLKLYKPGASKFRILPIDSSFFSEQTDREGNIFYSWNQPEIVIDNLMRIGKRDSNFINQSSEDEIYINPGTKWTDFPLFDQATGRRIRGSKLLPVAICDNRKEQPSLLCIDTEACTMEYLSIPINSLHRNLVLDMFQCNYSNAVVVSNFNDKPTVYYIPTSKSVKAKREVLSSYRDILSAVPCIDIKENCVYYKTLVKLSTGKGIIALSDKPSWLPNFDRDGLRGNYLPIALTGNYGVKIIIADGSLRGLNILEVDDSHKELSYYAGTPTMTLTGRFHYRSKVENSIGIDEDTLSVLGANVTYPIVSKDGYLTGYSRISTTLDLRDVKKLRKLSIPLGKYDIKAKFIRVSNKLVEFPDSDLIDTDRTSYTDWLGVIPEDMQIGKLQKFIKALMKGSNKMDKVILFVTPDEYPLAELADLVLTLALGLKKDTFIVNFYTNLDSTDSCDYPDSLDISDISDTNKRIRATNHGGTVYGIPMKNSVNGLVVLPYRVPNKNYAINYLLEGVLAGKLTQTLWQIHAPNNKDQLLKLSYTAWQNVKTAEYGEINTAPLYYDVITDLAQKTSDVVLPLGKSALTIASRTGYVHYIKRLVSTELTINTAVRDIMSIYGEEGTATIDWLRGYLVLLSSELFQYRLNTATKLYAEIAQLKSVAPDKTAVEINMDLFQPSPQLVEKAQEMIDIFSKKRR